MSVRVRVRVRCAVGQHRRVRVAPDEGSELHDGDESGEVGHLVRVRVRGGEKGEGQVVVVRVAAVRAWAAVEVGHLRLRVAAPSTLTVALLTMAMPTSVLG